MKAENRSFWGLAARGSLPCALGIMGLMTVLEPILFRALSWKSAALEFAVRDANLYLLFMLAMASPKAPTPGNTTASAAAISRGSLVMRASAPTARSPRSTDFRFPMR